MEASKYLYVWNVLLDTCFIFLKTQVLLHKENKVREVLIIGIRLPLSFGRKLCHGDSFLANQGLIP